MLDPQIKALEQLQWIPSRAWPNPLVIVRVPMARHDTTYKVAQPTIRGVLQTSYSTAIVPFDNSSVASVGAAQYNSLGTLNGSAPSGVYTGIPSGCGTGGNPYS